MPQTRLAFYHGAGVLLDAFTNSMEKGGYQDEHVPKQKKGSSGQPTPKDLLKKIGKKSVPTVKVGQNDLSQAAGKPFLPPGVYLWRANKKGTWNIHDPPHQPVSCPWTRYGGDSYLAYLDVLRSAWRQWLKDNRLPESDCPIVGLL